MEPDAGSVVGWTDCVVIGNSEDVVGELDLFLKVWISVGESS